MKYSYTLSEEDYLNYLYYSTSKSKRVQKRRAFNKLLLMVMYVVTGLFLWNKNGPIASAAFFLLCLPLYFLYNSFERRQYKKHFTKFIRLHFNDRIGKPIQLDVEENEIHITDEEDNHIPFSDIESFSETPSLIIIQLKSGNAFLIPKSSIEPTDAFYARLNQISSEGNIPFTKDLNWRWK